MNICGNTLLGASWWRTQRRNWRATLTQLPGTITPLLTSTHTYTLFITAAPNIGTKFLMSQRLHRKKNDDICILTNRPAKDVDCRLQPCHKFKDRQFSLCTYAKGHWKQLALTLSAATSPELTQLPLLFLHITKAERMQNSPSYREQHKLCSTSDTVTWVWCGLTYACSLV